MIEGVESRIEIQNLKNNEVVNEKMFSGIIEMVERVKNEPKIEYVWSGIKRGTFGYVYGPAKSGKTILCENLGMAIAAKLPEFLGMPINNTGIESVLFVSLEEFWKNRSERNAMQISVLQNINTDNFNYKVVNELFPVTMDFEKDWIALERTIVESQSKFVLIDSFTRLTSDEVEKSKVGSELSRRLKKLTNDLDITTVCIHHSSKINDTFLELANMAGSRVVGQEADFILGVNKLSDGTRYFKEVATRYKQESEFVTTFSINDYLWLIERNVVEEYKLFDNTIDHRENPSNEKLVFDTIKRLLSESKEVKTVDIVAHLDGKIGQTTLYGYFKNIEQKGLIDRSKKGYISLKKMDEK